MAKKMLFSFELEPGMRVYEDVLDSSGRLILSKGMILDNDTIQKLDFFSISEVPIGEPDVAPVKTHQIPDSEPVKGVSESKPQEYSDKVKSSPEYKSFVSAYGVALASVQRNLDELVHIGHPVDQVTLINHVFNLIKSCKTSIQIFDVMYNLEATDEPTYHHSLNVAIISVVLGRWLGMKRSDLNQLALAGILHDVGKVLIPVKVLNKNGKLTDEEFALIKSHVKKGYDIVKNQVLDMRIKDAVIYHHERCDGSGYPFRSTLENIPNFAKIIAIADVYDAMTSSRSYRKGHCPFEVIQIFDSEGLHKYDPQYIMTFLENIVASYVHNSVRLSDDRIGEIVMINSRCLYKPMVKVGNDFIDLYSEKDLKIVQVL